jgi:hypothetical protein
MTIKIRRQKKLDVPDKLNKLVEIREALIFLNPQLSADEINTKLLFTLTTIADSQLLQLLLNSVTELANKKVDEVSDLYCNFFNDNETTNNN